MKTRALFLFACMLTAPLFAAATLPAGYVPCRIHKHAELTFPLRLRHQGVTHGAATIVFEISPTGAVVDRLITQYTHPEFASELETTSRQWTFAPGTVNGQPITSVLTLRVEFTMNGVLLIERRFDSAREEIMDGEYAYAAHGAGTLDRRLVPVSASAPVYPSTWITEGRSGRVTVRFYVDEAGRVRMPTVVSQGDDLLAASAIAAVQGWRFEPPVAQGKPVLASVEQDFVFDPSAPKS